MKAQLKSGKVLTGKIAETLTRIGIAKEVSGEEVKALKVNKPKEAKPKVKKEAKPKKQK